MPSLEARFSRRQFLAASAAWSLATWQSWAAVAEADRLPASVAELWADFDPRREPLEVEILQEWKDGSGVFRLVRFLIGRFKGLPARMAAIYGFPASGQKLPAVMHIHGGGQRGSFSEVKLLVERGYAGLSVNWGGSGTGQPPFNSCEKAEPNDPNTDWGAVDPSQLNVPGYDSMLPGPKQFFEDREHPKNCNWYLLTLGCRRGLTFLEQQSVVDPERLGLHGYSMGGNLTMMVAATDARVQAAIPAVGGQGWRWEPHHFAGVKARPQNDVKGSVDLFRRTLSYESYAPLIRCPLLHRSATNDFHGWMDDVYRTDALIPDAPTRHSWTPHMNHQLAPEVAVTMPLWLDQHLKGGPALPNTPRSELLPKSTGGEPMLRVEPDQQALPVARCEIYYSIDADPRARFWRSAEVKAEGGVFTAKLPLHDSNLPLFAFANVYHALPSPVSMAALPGYAQPIAEVCISSRFHTMDVAELQRVKPTLSAQISTIIDDFSRGHRDWYALNAGNLAHQQLWTRKVTDPLWRGPDGARLRITLTMPRKNRLSIVLQQNEWRSYRGPRKTLVCAREIPGAGTPQTIEFSVADFSTDEHKLTDWSEIDQLGICARYVRPGSQDASPAVWNGPSMELHRVEWV